MRSTETPHPVLGRQWSRGTSVMATVALAGLAMSAIYVASVGRAAPEPTNGSFGVRLSVEPFDTSDSAPPGWDSRALADSLAARLARVPGLHAAVGSAGRSDATFVLRGSVRLRDDRIVITARLGSRGERETLWTATFWRASGTSQEILPDLAAAVAGAVGDIAARQALETSGGKQ